MAPALALQALLLAAALAPAAGLALQRADAAQPAPAAREHYWPHNFGPGSARHVTSHVAPANLSAALAWTWTHPDGRYATAVAGGPVIDADKNVYLSTNDGVWKISTDGQTLWHYKPPATMNNAPSLYGNAVYTTTQAGHAFALDMATGQLLWLKQAGSSAGGDSGYPAAMHGLFIFGVEPKPFNDPPGGNSRVVALNATTGVQVWDYRPQQPVWNFAPVSPDGETVVFMDYTGGVYRLNLHTGAELWHTSPPQDSESFGDGGLILGGNGFTYTCSNLQTGHGMEGSYGAVRSYSLADGHLVWEQQLPQPCNSYPAVGRLGAEGPSVVVTVGSFPGSPGGPRYKKHAGVLAFDAATGAPQWQYQAPAWYRASARGDREGLATRRLLDAPHAICLPASWSAPTISGDGTVYVGHLDGLLYSLRAPPPSSFNSSAAAMLSVDFETTPQLQVSTFDAGGAFLHGGVAAWAPGMMAMSSCDTLFVFKYPEP